jgi:hypothetical protein
MNRMVYHGWISVVKTYLKEKGIHISVRRTRLPPDVEGDCTPVAEDFYRIRISRDATYDKACEALTHELGHVLDGCLHEHGPSWGVSYSEAYALWAKFVEACNEQ